jgi:hypothetical protein
VLSLLLVHREKTGLVRKDFLDSMIELRKRSKRDVQEDTISKKNQKNDPKFGKLSISIITRDG